MPEITLSLSSHITLILLALPAAILVAAWAYRQTTPAVSHSVRILLAGLRASTLMLLIGILGEPVLSILSQSEEPPETVVLIDNSRSMGIRDSFEDRREGLKAVLVSTEIERLGSIGNARFVVFDRTAQAAESPTMDSLALDGDVTNLAQALRAVERERRMRNTRAVVIVSDGMITEGGNPVYEVDALGLPVYTVGIGDTSARRDVRIRTVLTNSVAYVETKVPVAVDIRSHGYEGERTEILLRSEEGIIDRHVLDLTEGTGRYDVALSLTPTRAGTRRYTVELSAPKDDAVAANNRLSFYVKVLESKLDVILIAGAPSADVAFIRRSLEGDPSLTVQTFIQQGDGTFSGGPLAASALEEANCLIMVGYPTTRSQSDALTLVAKAVQEGKNFLVVLSRSTDPAKLADLGPDLPASVSRISGAEQEVFLSIVLGEARNPLVRGAGESDPAQYWTQLPPVVRQDERIVARPESKVLLAASIQGGPSTEPVYVSRSVAGRKSLLFGAYGLWQWNMHEAEEESNPLGNFLAPAVRWLSTQEEEKALRVTPVKEIFSGQEPVELMAQLYDATLQPVDDADIRVQIGGRESDGEVLAQPLGSGRYVTLFEGLGEGSYSYTARATADGITLGTDQGSFSVGELTVEFQDVRLNTELLQQLADRSGGRFYQAATLRGLSETIAIHPQFQAATSQQANTLELWNTSWVLTLVVVLLATEWGVRKRSGML